MCGKPGYSTENTPSKKTSLRWGDDCPNIALADPNPVPARLYSLSSSIVAKSSVSTPCKDKRTAAMESIALLHIEQ